MGLFSRKSSEPKTSTQPKKQQINAEPDYSIATINIDEAVVKPSISLSRHVIQIVIGESL
jgi:hypothetical protein